MIRWWWRLRSADRGRNATRNRGSAATPRSGRSVRAATGYLNGTEYYWPDLVTVWHNEPGGADSGTVCHWRDSRWRLHVHHFSLQIHPWQDFKRWAFTRCAWCGGVSRKGDRVDNGYGWSDPPKRPFWWGESGLYHRDCMSVHDAHSICYCEDPALSHGDYGQCSKCGRFQAWRSGPTPAQRLLSKLRHGEHISDQLRPEVEKLWKQQREKVKGGTA